MRLDPIAVDPGPHTSAGAHGALAPIATRELMNLRHPERLVREQRLRTSREFSAVKAAGTPFRGRYCLLVVLACPGEPTRVGFVAGKRGVGGAVERNRARRRLREIVRRRWSRVAGRGWWMMFIAERSALGAPHALLAAEVERLLAGAGVLAPAAEAGR